MFIMRIFQWFACYTLSLSVHGTLRIQGTFKALLNLPRALCNMADQTISGVLQTVPIQRPNISESTTFYFALRWGRAHRKPTDNKGQIILSSSAGPHWPAFTLQYTEREPRCMPTAIHSFYWLPKTQTAVIWYTQISAPCIFLYLEKYELRREQRRGVRAKQRDREGDKNRREREDETEWLVAGCHSGPVAPRLMHRVA